MPAQRVSRTRDKTVSSSPYDAAQQLVVASARHRARSGPTRAGYTVGDQVRVSTVAAVVPPEIDARGLAVAALQLDVRRAGGCGHGHPTETRFSHPGSLLLVDPGRQLRRAGLNGCFQEAKGSGRARGDQSRGKSPQWH